MGRLLGLFMRLINSVDIYKTCLLEMRMSVCSGILRRRGHGLVALQLEA
jgi:hypothetical protein